MLRGGKRSIKNAYVLECVVLECGRHICPRIGSRARSAGGIKARYVCVGLTPPTILSARVL